MSANRPDKQLFMVENRRRLEPTRDISGFTLGIKVKEADEEPV